MAPETPRLLVVEQLGNRPFNRGAILNVGFDQVKEDAGWICFHDVDMLPIDDACDYSRQTCVTHLAGRVQQYAFSMPYPRYLGGVLAMPPREFAHVNGCSNAYWGWGSEDDDLYLRFAAAGIRIVHKPGRYRSLGHASGAQATRTREHFVRVARTALASGDEDAARTQTLLDDGLSTLRYDVRARDPLASVLTSSRIPVSGHDIVRVQLEMDPPASTGGRG